jgi:uridine kinase
MIIHISGAPGSGKTTIELKLKKYYKTKVIVKDLDDLFA